ncbi:hypothetical protein [Chlorogloeopsis sp. ULAP02]|uniref:hypothetical protein n=1 Tax=Chlorogloeopsis sp. ULAP02 TaxID=3107926 RepID=UPI003135F830
MARLYNVYLSHSFFKLVLEIAGSSLFAASTNVATAVSRLIVEVPILIIEILAIAAMSRLSCINLY